MRCDAEVTRIDTAGGRARAAVLADGERFDADAVVTAMDPKTALLDLADPPLSGRVADDLRATHRSNSVQALVHVAAEGLPPYTGARPGDLNGLQSYVDDVDALSRSFAAADARRLPAAPAAAYAFTTSALDDTLAPPGQHTVYLACPAAPFRIDEGWQRPARGWPRTSSTRSRRGRPAFATRSVASTSARPPTWPQSCGGRGRIRCTST